MKFYNEVDGAFVLTHEQYIETTFNSDNDLRTVFKDSKGTKVSEIRLVDGVQYSQYTIDGEDGEWEEVRVDESAQGEEQPVGPGEGAGGPAGPVGQIDDAPGNRANTICDDFYADVLAGAIDYGLETLDGVEVRHVALLVDAPRYSDLYDDDEYIVEYWVDLKGTTVQFLESEIYPLSPEIAGSRSWGGRERVDTLWTIADRDPPSITAPEISPTPAGQ